MRSRDDAVSLLLTRYSKMSPFRIITTIPTFLNDRLTFGKINLKKKIKIQKRIVLPAGMSSNIYSKTRKIKRVQLRKWCAA